MLTPSRRARYRLHRPAAKSRRASLSRLVSGTAGGGQAPPSRQGGAIARTSGVRQAGHSSETTPGSYRDDVPGIYVASTEDLAVLSLHRHARPLAAITSAA